MLTTNSIARRAAFLAAAVLVFQPQFLFADSPTAAAEVAINVTDVQLGNNGVLFGQLLDAQGRQLPVAEIVVTNGARTWKSYTDTEGNFRIEGVSNRELYKFAQSLDEGGMGIGIYPRSQFVHIDFRAPGEPSYRWTDRSPPDGNSKGKRPSRRARSKRPSS